MKYSRILFTIKNDNFLLNILPVIEHPVKNKGNEGVCDVKIYLYKEPKTPNFKCHDLK